VLFTGGRQGLIYNPFYTEAGLEAGFYISDFAMFTASAGTNVSTNSTLTKNPTYTARLELDPKLGKVGLLLGGSYAKAEIPQKTDFYGGFIGLGYKRFSLLGEFDLGKNVIANGQKSNFAMAEASYIITLGLEAVVRYDRLDPDTSIDKDELQRVVVGLEWFIYSFVEIRPQYRFMFEDPSVKNDSAVLQFHFWY
jgi:hypothetical protein